MCLFIFYLIPSFVLTIHAHFQLLNMDRISGAEENILDDLAQQLSALSPQHFFRLMDKVTGPSTARPISSETQEKTNHLPVHSTPKDFSYIPQHADHFNSSLSQDQAGDMMPNQFQVRYPSTYTNPVSKPRVIFEQVGHTVPGNDKHYRFHATPGPKVVRHTHDTVVPEQFHPPNIVQPSLNFENLSQLGVTPVPKLPTFSGDGKGDFPYKQWKYQVRCLINDPRYNDNSVLQAIRQSVRGTAANFLVCLGENIELEVLLDKFDSMFGNVYSSGQLFQQFYSAEQKANEEIVAWGCRIQQLLAQLKESEMIPNDQELLRSKFFSGITNKDLREAIRHRFDSGESYDQLFRAARSIEFESNKSTKSKMVSQQTSVDERLARSLEEINKNLLELKQAIKNRENPKPHPSDTRSKDSLTSKNNSNDATIKSQRFCERCGRRGHSFQTCHAKKDVPGNPLNL